MRRDAVIRMEAGKTLTIGSRVSTNHEPDMFRVDIEFSGSKSSKEECFASYKSSVLAVEDAFEMAGFDPSEIKSDQLSLSPSYRYVYESGDGRRAGVGPGGVSGPDRLLRRFGRRV